MANVISGLDSAWAFPTLAGLKEFKAQGGLVAFGYLSGDPSKNWTPARLKMVHSLGLGAGMNFESTAGRALAGYNAGMADGGQAWDEIAALVRGVGYAPRSRLHVIASADFDAQPSQFPAIDAYLRGFAAGLLSRHANADQGVYGSYALVVHTAAAGTSHAEWQTYAWSGGRFFIGAEYYQWSNDHNSFGGAVDYDQVIDAAHLGAWWPPGSPYDQGDDVSQADVIAALKSPEGITAIQSAVWNTKIGDPTDPLRKRTYLARQYLTSTYAHTTGIAGIAANVVKLATGIDVEATATALKDRLLALLGAGGTTPGGTA